MSIDSSQIEQTDARLDQPKSHILRAELKAWEKAFAAANDGRKAEREDIKKNPAIGTQLPTLLLP